MEHVLCVKYKISEGRFIRMVFLLKDRRWSVVHKTIKIGYNCLKRIMTSSFFFPYQLMLQELLALRLQYSHYKYHQGKESQMVIPSKPLNYTTTPQNHFPTTHVAKYIILHHDASQSCLVNQCYNYCYWALLHSRSSKNDTRLFLIQG